MKKVFAYLRVSTTNQLDGHGFERQLATIEKYCKQARYKIEKVFEEQVSGTKDEAERPIFYSMIGEIMANHCKTVVVESLDRLAREYRIQETLLVMLASKDIALIAANTGENITEAIQADPMKKALIQMQGIFHELDKALIIKRLQDGRKRSEKPQGRKPYGTRPGEADVLELIHTLHKPTKTRRGLSYPTIAALLNSRNITTRRGNKFSASLVYHYIRTKL